MKKTILFLFIFFAACSSPQVTAAPFAEVTATSPPKETPIPTPTMHPAFISLQESIASSGERFTLSPEGILLDNGQIIPGLHVDRTGVMTLMVGGEFVTLNPDDVSFDDETGVTIKGYEMDEDGDEWVVAEVLPEFLLELQKNGIEVDIEKGVAWNPEDGRVMGLVAPDGSWTEMPNGEAVFNLTNGETLTIPIFDDIESALDYAINDVGIWWGNTTAWMQSAETASDIAYRKKIRLSVNFPEILAGTTFGDVTLCQSDAPKVCAPIKIGESVLDGGNRLPTLWWRSQSDGNLHKGIIVDDTQAVLDALNSGSVVVPTPVEGD